MKNLVKIIVISVFSFFLFSGCASAPQQMVDETKSVLDDVKAYSADVYCKETFDSAQASFNQAMVVILDQDKKLPFFRKYSQAIQYLANSKETALKAKAGVEAGKEKLKNEVNNSIIAINVLVDSVNLQIENAKSKGMNVTSWTADIDSAKVIMSTVSNLISGGDFITAGQKVAIAKSKITVVKQDIEVLIPSSRK